MTPIFYHPKQQCSYDFISLRKIPEYVRQSGRKPESDFDPMTNYDLATAHSMRYVERVFNLEESNGFGNYRSDVNDTLRYSVASFNAAADRAFVSGKVACSASQGFHHAHHDMGWGFCTFNGLMIAAKRYVINRVNRVLIIDGDGHAGDGTDDIIKRLELENEVAHVGRDELGMEQTDWTAKDWIEYTSDLIRRLRPGIIFYQAGADAWLSDPYGAGYLSMEGLAARDRGVFEAARDAQVPVVWNLAGGYADPMQKTIDIHLQTLKISDEVFYG